MMARMSIACIFIGFLVGQASAATLPTADINGFTATESGNGCAGDCNASGMVTVNELLRLVNASLHDGDPEGCASADLNVDGRIAIDEILTAVSRALRGCMDDRPRRIDAIVAGFAGSDTPAAVVMISRGDLVLHEKAYGLADIEAGRAATLDDVFFLASISKSFTSTAVLRLVAEGELSLEDPISEYVTEL